ncbi:MAG: SH3 domain-containing protein [Candidatus Aminicenantes bacterium]|nr:SH3 domain-containing protein [Candidatus Aminicenantes bacterium]
MKKNKIIPFSVLLLLLAVAGRAVVEDDFSTANARYAAGRYGEALGIYLRISRQLTNWHVLYNIGNCYFKLGQPLAAKIHYLRARKFRPLDGSIARNIAIVNKSFKDITLAAPTIDFISRVIQVVQARLDVNLLSLLLLAAILTLNVFLFLLLKNGKRKKIVYGLAFSLLASLALGVYLYDRAAGQQQTSIAVVSEADSVLRSGPGEGNTELFKINPGLEVKILDRSRDWVQVSASSQVAGWIELKRLTLI